MKAPLERRTRRHSARIVRLATQGNWAIGDGFAAVATELRPVHLSPRRSSDPDYAAGARHHEHGRPAARRPFPQRLSQGGRLTPRRSPLLTEKLDRETLSATGGGTSGCRRPNPRMRPHLRWAHPVGKADELRPPFPRPLERRQLEDLEPRAGGT